MLMPLLGPNCPLTSEASGLVLAILATGRECERHELLAILQGPQLPACAACKQLLHLRVIHIELRVDEAPLAIEAQLLALHVWCLAVRHQVMRVLLDQTPVTLLACSTF